MYGSRSSRPFGIRNPIFSGNAGSGGRTITPCSSIQIPVGTFTTPNSSSMRCF